MVKLLRIDDRLIHGQVAYGWTQARGVSVILIVNDDVAGNEMRKVAYNVGKPAGCKLYFRDVKEGVEAVKKLEASNHKCLVLVDNVKDALTLVKESGCIRTVNLGGQRMADGKRFITTLVAVDDSDIAMLKEIEAAGTEVEVRKLPSETKRRLEELI